MLPPATANEYLFVALICFIRVSDIFFQLYMRFFSRFFFTHLHARSRSNTSTAIASVGTSSMLRATIDRPGVLFLG
jgi:hypothetical protein